MEKVTIQPAEKTDFPYITAKLKNYILDATAVRWQDFFVARLGRKIVAFGRIIDHGEYFELASLGVDYYHRKKGIGIKMLHFLKEKAKKLDPEKPMYGVTHRPGFLQKVGFEEIEKGPEALEYKKYKKCILPPSKRKIMKLNSGSTKGGKTVII